MLESGGPMPTVSEVLGHSTVRVAGDINGDLSAEGALAAMDRLAQALGW